MPKKIRSCKNDPDIFCYICGELTLLKYRRNLTDKIKRLYYAYFGCENGLFFRIVPTRVSFFFSRSRASGMLVKKLSQVIFLPEFSISLDQIFDNSCSLVYFSSNCRILSSINLHLPCIRCVGFAYCPNFDSILSRF